jgi:mRNA interferase MazF
MSGEFPLADWTAAGLNVPTAVKRGIYTVHFTLVLKRIGQLSAIDAKQLEVSTREWLGLT